MFQRLGIEETSIREIAKEAGYTPGAIYSYFDNKEAIYGALLAESLERLDAAVGATGGPGLASANQLNAKASAWFGFLQPTHATWTWTFIWCKVCSLAG